MGTYFGFTVAFEVKTPVAYRGKNNGLTANQIAFKNDVTANGGFAFVVCAIHQVEEALQYVETRIVELLGEPYLAALR
jgi:penicillin-binding protein-related factor A (putative recombinase)